MAAPSDEPHPFLPVDRAAVARALSQLAERPGDVADAWFERIEEVELPPEERGPGVRVRREEGLAVRLLRIGGDGPGSRPGAAGRGTGTSRPAPRDASASLARSSFARSSAGGASTWLAARDALEPAAFSEALRQTARVLPAASYSPPAVAAAPWPGPAEAPEVLAFPAAVHRAVRERRAAFPLALTVRRHRRWVLVVGAGKVVPEPQAESFYSVHADLGWGRWGALFPGLGETEAQRVATALVDRFRAREAAPPRDFRGTVVLGPAAAAVFLHEAVAHALEADLLATGGDPEAAVGVRLGSDVLHVLDDPSAAPAPVRRDSDDEGNAVRRRWLLRGGVVTEPLADALWAGASEVLAPGAGRRAGRHDLPSPRSTFLELLPGELDDATLLGGGEVLHLEEADGGRLDPLTGTFQLRFATGRRWRGGEAAESTGPCRLRGRVADLLAAVRGAGREVEAAGAGWCAKGGRKLPVWAACPALRLDDVAVEGLGGTPGGASGGAS